MNEKFNPERITRKKLGAKELMALTATAALAMGLAACSKEEVTATPESAPQSVEVVEDESLATDDEFKLPKIENTYEYVPVISEAIIDYDLLDGWEELSNNQRSKRAFNFFEANDILPINWGTAEEAGSSRGQAAVDSIQERLDLVHEVINDVTDSRNQEFGIEMAKYGIFYPELDISDENTDSFSDFMSDLELDVEFVREENSLPAYRLGRVLQYTPEGYYSDNGVYREMALWIETEGARPSIYGEEFAFFQMLVFTKHYTMANQQMGTFPLLVAISEGELDMRVRQNEEPTVVRAE